MKEVQLCMCPMYIQLYGCSQLSFQVCIASRKAAEEHCDIGFPSLSILLTMQGAVW